ncbi:GNAT family N-acetyltransferase [Ferrimonas gelatinilytica]|uniref:N-acetyltransferase domain-containing protein n=1 Tax=Ferrimonas gelatinilytica TaxID=1255257 RepID=A0ABP9SAY9_9GAMM
MPECAWLTPMQAPLASRFYAQEGQRERVRRDERVAVVRENHRIIAALRLSPRQGHTLLRALRVAVDRQGRGLALRLLQFALAETGSSVWCYALPELEPLYRRVGFVPESTAPGPIIDPFKAYCRRQSLRLMQWRPPSE